MSVTFRVEKLNPACGWFEQVEGTPEVNLSNANADAVLGALGVNLAPEYCGSMDPQDFEAWFARFERACEQGRGAEFERRGFTSKGGEGRARVISCGLDVEGLRARLFRLARVARAAAAIGATLGWV